ncbi:MAG: hypothetical protein IJT27_02375 [Clostridia bacterium]|nr:hypothetical protein [Clostridia bacterium]
MAEHKNNAATGRKTARQGRLSVWRVAGLTVVIVLFIVAAAVVLSGRGGGKKGNASSSDVLLQTPVYAISAESVSDMQAFAGRLALLRSNDILYLDESGNEIAVNEHKYDNPVMLTAGKNLLLFDRGGDALRIEKNADIFSEIKVTAPITCADINAKGTYAYVLNADGGFQSHLYVFSYKGTKLFEWGSASDYVLGVTLSENGRYIVVNELRVDNAEHTSRVICFKLGRETPVFSADFAGVTVFETRFVSAKNVVAVSDRGVFRITGDDTYETVREYAQNEMNGVNTGEDKINLLVLNLYGNEKNPEITLYDKRFKKSNALTLNASVTSFCVSGYNAAVVSGDTVYALNAHAIVTGQTTLSETCSRLAISGKRVFVLTSGGVCSFHVSAMTDQSA